MPPKPAPLRVVARFHHGINDGGEIGLYNRRKLDPPVQLRVAGKATSKDGTHCDYLYDLVAFRMDDHNVTIAEYFAVGYAMSEADAE